MLPLLVVDVTLQLVQIYELWDLGTGRYAYPYRYYRVPTQIEYNVNEFINHYYCYNSLFCLDYWNTPPKVTYSPAETTTKYHLNNRLQDFINYRGSYNQIYNSILYNTRIPQPYEDVKSILMDLSTAEHVKIDVFFLEQKLNLCLGHWPNYERYYSYAELKQLIDLNYSIQIKLWNIRPQLDNAIVNNIKLTQPYEDLKLLLIDLSAADNRKIDVNYTFKKYTFCREYLNRNYIA